MGIVRFISDPHFGHNNMAIKRGFNSSVEHDAHIISQWNQVVSKRDTTWILGDITMEKNDYEILNMLNGNKRVILGNHDQGKHSKFLQNYVNSIHGLTKFTDKEHGTFWLSHCPVHPSELLYRVNRNIHGHLHENFVETRITPIHKGVDKRYINVCMEVQDYMPKTIKQLVNNI